MVGRCGDDESLARAGEQLLQRIESRGLDRRVVPSVAARCLELRSHPDFSVNDLARLIENDPLMAARVVHLANSAGRATLDAGELDDDAGAGLVEVVEWPKIQAQVLRRRLETAGVPVMIEWSGSSGDRRGLVLVPEDQAEFAAAVVNEIDVDDEVSDDSPHAYVARIDEHLSAVSGLLDELRTRLDDLEADGRL